MNYIYDVLLNFNNHLYDFFEWDINDNITHIRKIPLIKVNRDTLLSFKNNKFKIGDDLLSIIMNKTECFSNNGIKNINYACLFCDNEATLAVKFNKDGLSISKSNMLLDESDEVIDFSCREKGRKIDYQIIEEDIKTEFISRNTLMKINYIEKELNRLNRNNEIDKIKFLYYDCFDKKEDNVEIIISNIKDALKSDFLKIDNMYDFLKMTFSKKMS